MIREMIKRIEGRLKASCAKQDRLLWAKAIRALERGAAKEESLAIVRESLRRHLGAKVFKHKGWGVYQMNDYDWWASRKKSQGDVLEEYLAFVEGDEDLREESEELRALTQGEMLGLIFCDDDGNMMTFMDVFMEEINEHKNCKGFPFASTEY